MRNRMKEIFTIHKSTILSNMLCNSYNVKNERPLFNVKTQ